MSELSQKAKSIFMKALELSLPAAQAALIAENCGNDPALHGEVEDLLRHHRQVGSFLEPQLECTGPGDIPLTGGLGTTIGPYRLREVLGEGGMGTGYVAEQERPVRRRVALKVIKPGMDTRAVIARFEAERQALALMDHPNIAKVLDAGTTGAERIQDSGFGIQEEDGQQAGQGARKPGSQPQKPADVSVAAADPSLTPESR